MRRACARAEMPRNFVRIVAQDSGSNVNAGWYLVGASAFGAQFLRYLTEVKTGRGRFSGGVNGRGAWRAESMPFVELSHPTAIFALAAATPTAIP